jgi:hypothetical protein
MQLDGPLSCLDPLVKRATIISGRGLKPGKLATHAALMRPTIQLLVRSIIGEVK